MEETILNTSANSKTWNSTPLTKWDILVLRTGSYSHPARRRWDASPANPFSRLPAHWCESTFISSFSLKHTLERAGVRALRESIFKRPADNAPLAPFLLTRCAAVPAFFPSPSRERYHLVGKKGWGEPQGHGYGNDYRLRGLQLRTRPHRAAARGEIKSRVFGTHTQPALSCVVRPC